MMEDPLEPPPPQHGVYEQDSVPVEEDPSFTISDSLHDDDDDPDDAAGAGVHHDEQHELTEDIQDDEPSAAVEPPPVEQRKKEEEPKRHPPVEDDEAMMTPLVDEDEENETTLGSSSPKETDQEEENVIPKDNEQQQQQQQGGEESTDETDMDDATGRQEQEELQDKDDDSYQDLDLVDDVKLVEQEQEVVRAEEEEEAKQPDEAEETIHSTVDNDDASRTASSDNDNNNAESELVPVPYCGVWGTLTRERRQADLTLLYQLFDDMVVNPKEEDEPRANATAMAQEITDHAFEQAKREDVQANLTIDDRVKAKASANNEFVDGLDDIDKFFEDVDPPDELDVGAGGSSIQEVLMGSGSRIVIKRITMGLNFVKRYAIIAKDKIVDSLRDEDGEIQLFKRETIEHAAKQTVEWGKKGFHAVQKFLDNLFEKGSFGFLSDEAEDDDDLDFQFESPIAKMKAA